MSGQTNIHEITLALLIGGESSRMGRSKASLEVSGKPVLEYLYGQFDWPGPKMLVGASGQVNAPGAEHFDQLATDPVAGAGPLRGILTAMEASSTEMVIVCTVDMPCIKRMHLEWLGKQLADRQSAASLFLTRDVDGQSILEPFPSAYRLSAQKIVKEQLAEQRKAMHLLSGRKGFQILPAPADWPVETWTNLNTPEDLAAFQQKFAS